MAPSAATVMRLRYVARLLCRASAFTLVILGVVGTWFALDQYIGWKTSPTPTLPAGVAWSAESTFVRQMYRPGLFLGLAVALVLLERFLVPWLVPVPLRRCPGCGYAIEKSEAAECPECGMPLGSLAVVDHPWAPADRPGTPATPRTGGT